MGAHRAVSVFRTTPRSALVIVLVLAAVLSAAVAAFGLDGQAQAATDTRLIQRDLAGLGYLPFNGVDGAYGPHTRAAVRSFQAARCLSTDGVAGPITTGALESVVKRVQSAAGAGVDGDYGPITRSRVAGYQRSHRLAADGVAGPATMASMGIVRRLSCGGGGSSGGSGLGAKAAAIARAQLGKPYVWGAAGPNSFDCSGLVWYAYFHAGLNWGRTTAQGQHDAFRLTEAAGHFSLNGLEVGDLLYFHTDSSGVVTHVGIYAGNGLMIEAPHTGDVVKTISASWYASAYPFEGANRP